MRTRWDTEWRYSTGLAALAHAVWYAIDCRGNEADVRHALVEFVRHGGIEGVGPPIPRRGKVPRDAARRVRIGQSGAF